MILSLFLPLLVRGMFVALFSIGFYVEDMSDVVWLLGIVLPSP